MLQKAAQPEAILLFIPEWNGMHPGAWRLPESPRDGAMDFALLLEMVRRAEQAKLHGLFLTDATSFRLELSYESLARTATAFRFEPFTLMAALATVTERIGLVMTCNTTFEEPYNVARRMASLDHLSHGRAGWNVVTVGNPSVARHFGSAPMMGHDERYARGAEFVDAVRMLWDSFEDGALVADKESGVYWDIDKAHAETLSGEYITASGLLNSPRSPQGQPVIAQAGSSAVGRAFAARYADLVFCLQGDFERARAYYREMKAMAADLGRRPHDMKILPSLVLVVADTDEAAAARFREMDALVDHEVGLELLSALLHHDLSGLGPDDMLPDIPETKLGTKTVQAFFVDKAREEDLTISELVSFMLRWGAIGGSPTTIADYIEKWVLGEAADGFGVTFADHPRSMDLFFDQVVPQLQRRGVFQSEYRGTTLREHLSLERPQNAYARRAVDVA
jgi:FMN-dependent oxidoreductase (nitrilotriacetate monooxygenase family)